MKFGIELEIIGCNPQEAAAAISAAGVECNSERYNHQIRSGWKVVLDGSVSRGCEIVSPPMEINEESFNALRKVCTALNDLGVGVDRSCGVHVHIDMNNERPQTIANVYNRYKKFETEIDRFMPESRRGTNNGYSRSLAGTADQNFQSTSQIQSYSNMTTRYMKVNLCSFVKYGTIEFRQHSGSTNASKLIKWITFLSEFVVASRVSQPTASTSTSTPAQSINGLSAKRRSLVRLITDEAMTAPKIATRLNSTAASVQSMICHILQIIRLPRTGAYKRVDQSQAVAALATQDFLGRGISLDVTRYFARRTALLS